MTWTLKIYYEIYIENLFWNLLWILDLIVNLDLFMDSSSKYLVWTWNYFEFLNKNCNLK